jgi:hypothetical protein
MTRFYASLLLVTEKTDAVALSPEEHERVAGGQQLVLQELRGLLMARLTFLIHEPTATADSVLAFITMYGRALQPLALLGMQTCTCICAHTYPRTHTHTHTHTHTQHMSTPKNLPTNLIIYSFAELLRDAPPAVRGAVVGLHAALAMHFDDHKRTAAQVEQILADTFNPNTGGFYCKYQSSLALLRRVQDPLLSCRSVCLLSICSLSALCLLSGCCLSAVCLPLPASVCFYLPPHLTTTTPFQAYSSIAGQGAKRGR